KLSSAIHTAVAEIVGGPVRVEFCPAAAGSVQPDGQPRRQRPAPLLAELDVSRDAPDVRVRGGVAVGGGRPRYEIFGALAQHPRSAAPAGAGSPFNARYTFDSFV